MTTKGRPSKTRSGGRSAQTTKGRAATRKAEASDEATRRGVFADHAKDLWAVGLVTLGVLLALAVYGSAAGTVGHGVNEALGAVVGWARFLLPPVLVLGGALLVMSRDRPEPLRIGVGAALLFVSVVGLAELAGGSPGPTASQASLRGAGGWLGVAAGRPMQLGLGTFGAVVILVACAVVGVLFVSKASLGSLGRAGAGAVGATGRVVSDWWAGGHRPDPPVAPAPGAPVVAEPPAEAPVADEAPSPPALDDTGEFPVVPAAPAPPPTPAPALEPAMTGAAGEWHLPSPGLLARSKATRLDERQIDAAGEDLVRALAAHGVDTKLVGRTVGPTVTRYELELGPGVKVARVTSLSKDIAYAMASPDVRILAPIPGRRPSASRCPTASASSSLWATSWPPTRRPGPNHPLEVALGRDIAGRAGAGEPGRDAPRPHLRGDRGRQVVVHQLDASRRLDARHAGPGPPDPGRPQAGRAGPVQRAAPPAHPGRRRPEEGRQRAGLGGQGDGAPLRPPGRGRACATSPATTRPSIAGSWTASRRPERRLRTPRAKRPSEPAPERVADGDEQAAERLPFVLVVVDELNDLMMVAARDVEESVCRIAQMARAVGIHLVLATQRPSVDVITGVIKANIPTPHGLLGVLAGRQPGDLGPAGGGAPDRQGGHAAAHRHSSNPRRLQGPWVSEDEVRSVVAHWRRQGRRPSRSWGIEGAEERQGGPVFDDEDDDDLLPQAMELVVRSQLGSTSMLQRKLRVGFARAGRLMDLLERRGVVGPRKAPRPGPCS